MTNDDPNPDRLFVPTYLLCNELKYPEPENTRVNQVIERFAAVRLLVKGEDIENNLYVEPAHDALVRGWQKLRKWKDQELASVQLQRELTAIASKWDMLHLAPPPETGFLANQ